MSSFCLVAGFFWSTNSRGGRKMKQRSGWMVNTLTVWFMMNSSNHQNSDWWIVKNIRLHPDIKTCGWQTFHQRCCMGRHLGGMCGFKSFMLMQIHLSLPLCTLGNRMSRIGRSAAWMCPSSGFSWRVSSWRIPMDDMGGMRFQGTSFDKFFFLQKRMMPTATCIRRGTFWWNFVRYMECGMLCWLKVDLEWYWHWSCSKKGVGKRLKTSGRGHFRDGADTWQSHALLSTAANVSGHGRF